MSSVNFMVIDILDVRYFKISCHEPKCWSLTNFDPIVVQNERSEDHQSLEIIL